MPSSNSVRIMIWGLQLSGKTFWLAVLAARKKMHDTDIYSRLLKGVNRKFFKGQNSLIESWLDNRGWSVDPDFENGDHDIIYDFSDLIKKKNILFARNLAGHDKKLRLLINKQNKPYCTIDVSDPPGEVFRNIDTRRLVEVAKAVAEDEEQARGKYINERPVIDLLTADGIIYMFDPTKTNEEQNLRLDDLLSVLRNYQRVKEGVEGNLLKKPAIFCMTKMDFFPDEFVCEPKWIYDDKLIGNLMKNGSEIRDTLTARYRDKRNVVCCISATGFVEANGKKYPNVMLGQDGEPRLLQTKKLGENILQPVVQLTEFIRATRIAK